MNWFKKSQVINTEEDARKIAPKYNLHYNGIMYGRDRYLFQFTKNDGNGTTISLRPGEDIRSKIK
jgi:hypothetical protein